MNAAKVQADEYINFLIATPKACSATEAARVQPDGPLPAAPFTRLLQCLEPNPDTLWREVHSLLDSAAGVLVVDDTTLDKPRVEHTQLVAHHWSSNHRAVVRDINLGTAMWSDGDRLYPCDYRVYHKTRDGKTRNDHFVHLLAAAHARGFRPRAVLFDGWYASVGNLKRVRGCGWVFVTRFKANRKVRLDHGDLRPLGEQPVAAVVPVAWVPGSGR